VTAVDHLWGRWFSCYFVPYRHGNRTMARKASDVIQYKIRIREDLRRRLETAAKKRDVSINSEIANRLGESFDREEMLKLKRITADMEQVFKRFAAETRKSLLVEDLMRAAEELIRQLPADIQEREVIKPAVEQVRTAIKVLALQVGRIPEDER
jgi:hypothetical protein